MPSDKRGSEAASRSLRTQVDDGQVWDVGQPYSTRDIPEQGGSRGVVGRRGHPIFLLSRKK